MYEADIKAMDTAKYGARSWMPPQVGAGFFMTPYNSEMWKSNAASPGMGAIMVSATQMFPNAKKLNANYNLMNAMSSVETENRNYTLNQLEAIAKANYYQWLILNKKIKVAQENLSLLEYMIKSMGIRYQYNMDKLPTYYKAKSQYSALESMIVMLKNQIAQKRIMLNTVMARDKAEQFEIEDNFEVKEYSAAIADTSLLSKNRSDVQAIEKSIVINKLKIAAERTNFLPEFGLRYDHMFGFGTQPQRFSFMGMATIPVPWSTKMNKANINSYTLKNESLKWQKEMILNEALGMLSGMNTELANLNKQYEIAQKSIIPALKKNYETSILAWQNNTGDLFATLDAWEALNMAEIDAIDKLQQILAVQVEIERQLENK